VVVVVEENNYKVKEDSYKVKEDIEEEDMVAAVEEEDIRQVAVEDIHRLWYILCRENSLLVLFIFEKEKNQLKSICLFIYKKLRNHVKP
jgi:hypothetical protein